MTKNLLRTLVVGASVTVLSLLVGSEADAASFNFSKIADTSTLVTNGSGNFTDFGAPAIDGSNVAFRGKGSNGQDGIYISEGGTLKRIADRNSLGQSDNEFFTLTNPSIDRSDVAFSAYKAIRGGDSIYTNIGGKLNSFESAIFGSFAGPPSLDKGNVTYYFNAARREPRQEINSTLPGLSNVARSAPVVATPLPDGSGRFFSFGSFPSLNNGSIAFYGTGSNDRRGIYIREGETLKAVVENTNGIPNGIGNFSDFGNFSLNNGSVAFFATGANNQQGIYTNLSGRLSLVADTTINIPDGNGNFLRFDNPSLDNGNVAFSAIGSNGQQGIYTNLGGTLTKVIDLKDLLDGKSLSSLSVERESLSGNAIAFLANFTNGSRGIFRADLAKKPLAIPEPSLIFGVLAVATFGCTSFRRKSN
ncbi:MAG: PEP-CTERM sorting domain-containing protein [Scytonematopsis contorta HA4267-MV1]|jgi:hypothetical protein|nr:PEP-CTERM sorting domain-containing protein [Scytonematopsis contorta HA4267-MV1]